MKNSLTCISCPVGCKIFYELSEDKSNIININGNLCPKGEKYANDEVFNPKRILTTTVYVKSADKMLPVRSDKAMPKEQIMDCIKKIKKLCLPENIKAGQVIYENIIDDINIIATSDNK